jgi:hypothetical protein
VIFSIKYRTPTFTVGCIEAEVTWIISTTKYLKNIATASPTSARKKRRLPDNEDLFFIARDLKYISLCAIFFLFRPDFIIFYSFLTERYPIMPVILKTTLLLILSNIFMTFAWYAHLRNLLDRKWFIAAIISWMIAFFEYMIQVPANRIGYSVLSLGQLKILQEVITLSVFVPFAVLYMRQPLKLNFLWAGLCLVGAVFFIFKT